MSYAENLREHYSGVKARLRAYQEPLPKPGPKIIWLNRPAKVARPAVVRRITDFPAEKVQQVTRDWLLIASPGDFDEPNIKDILRLVSEHFGYSTFALKSERRHAGLVRARGVVYYLAKELTSKSYPTIAREVGGRDHTTILHGRNRIIALLQSDAELATQVNLLRAKLEGVAT